MGSNRITIGQRSRDLLRELGIQTLRLVELGELGELTLGVGQDAGPLASAYRCCPLVAPGCRSFAASSTFKLHTIRYALITIGSLLLILATILLLQQPGLPG